MATRKPGRARAAKRTTSRKPSRPRPTARTRKAPRKPKAAHTRSARPAKMARSKPETLRLRSITPGFTADDLERSMTFYGEALGFVVSERWTRDDGSLRGVMMKAGSCELGLSQDDWAKGRDRKKGQGVGVWLETSQDVDVLAARVKAAGYPLAEEPKDQPWGARSFSVDDPDGFHLTFFHES